MIYLELFPIKLKGELQYIKEIYYCEENEKLLWEILRDDIMIIQLKAEKFLRRLKGSW